MPRTLRPAAAGSQRHNQERKLSGKTYFLMLSQRDAWVNIRKARFPFDHSTKVFFA
ncbi:hypothetical protein KHP57_08530 [Algiphilus sp. NNCM1]|nr:hypothetical protein [Algiphilus acroporae]